MVRGQLSEAELQYFEEPLPDGWVYQCTLDDVRRQLSRLPPDDLRGLHAVGLAASTRRDRLANARYSFSPQPVIRLYSLPADLRYKVPAVTCGKEIERGLAVELEYGARVEQVRRRYYVRWEAPGLHRFILDHVLPHELGHHVYHTRRREAGHVFKPGTRESEQAAEAYAVRIRSRLGPS